MAKYQVQMGLEGFEKGWVCGGPRGFFCGVSVAAMQMSAPWSCGLQFHPFTNEVPEV